MSIGWRGVFGGAMTLLLAAGCSSSEVSRSVERRLTTADSASQMRRELREADAQIQATQKTLNLLTNGPSTTPLKKRFAMFRADVDRSEETSNQVNSRATSLTMDSYRQINEWVYQAGAIRDEPLRQKSLQREAEAQQRHLAVVSAANEMRGAYARYIRELQDIRMFIANDLTPAGLKGLTVQNGRAGELAAELRRQLALLDRELELMAASWQAEGMPETSASARPAAGAVSAYKESVPANTPVELRQ